MCSEGIWGREEADTAVVDVRREAIAGGVYRHVRQSLGVAHPIASTWTRAGLEQRTTSQCSRLSSIFLADNAARPRSCLAFYSDPDLS